MDVAKDMDSSMINCILKAKMLLSGKLMGVILCGNRLGYLPPKGDKYNNNLKAALDLFY